jgi:hypothetical protein
MSLKAHRYLIIILAAATIVSSVVAWNQSRRVTALSAELRKASADANALKPKPAPVAAAFTNPPAPPVAVAPSENDAPSPGEEPAAQPARQRGNRSNFAALMANPDFAKAMNVQQRAALDARYATLFKKLNLNPAELEKFKDLLVERQSARMDVMNAARESGLNPRDNRDELRKLTEEAQAEVDANIKVALGETRFDQYQNYETTQPQRTVISQLDQRLSYTSTPLNSTQSEFLVNALAASNAPAADQGAPGNWGGPGRTAITDDVIQRAQSILTPDQLAALKQLQAEQQAQQQVRELMRAGAGGATTNRATGSR